MMHRLAAVALSSVLATGSTAASQPSDVPDPNLRAFVEQMDREWPGARYQHTITADSVNLLAKAIVSLARRHGVVVRLADDIALLSVESRRYQAGAADDRQPARLRRMLIQASTLIQRLLAETNHARRPGDSELNALRRAAESLDPSQSLYRQRGVIERFFAHAAGILQRLDQPDAVSLKV